MSVSQGRRGQREYGLRIPKIQVSPERAECIVKNPDEEAALGIGWANTPAAFDPYRGPRLAQPDPQACLKWVDEWPVPDLSEEHRTTIKVHLLKTDAAFCKSPDDPSTVADCMQSAFDGVAQVLFGAGILTAKLVEKDIPEFVWDTAIAGGWWRFASETHPGISCERIGHYWVWWDESRDWPGICRGVRALWRARLLEARAQTARTRPRARDNPRPALHTDRINQWIAEEGYDNQELARILRLSLRTVTSMRNNQKYHGRHAVAKLAARMQLDPTDLYRR